MDTIYYLDAETVSKAFACLLEQGATSGKDELSPYLSQSIIEKMDKLMQK